MCLKFPCVKSQKVGGAPKLGAAISDPSPPPGTGERYRTCGAPTRSLSPCSKGQKSERCLIRLTFWGTLWEQFGLSDQSALIDASVWRKPLENLCKSSTTQPQSQPSKPLWQRDGLNISWFKPFRCISHLWSFQCLDVPHGKEGQGTQRLF